MSHHYSGPDWAFPRGDARLDLADLYAFPKPDDASKSIFVMNVHPSYGENPGGPTSNIPFAPEALYELKIDSDGDSVADIAYRVRFSRSQRGNQAATLCRAEGMDARAAGDEGQKIVEHAPISTGLEARITEGGDHRFFAGWRSDPFFFDRRGAINNLQFTGDDFFADKNVCSMVLEVPNSALPPKAIGLWHGIVNVIVVLLFIGSWFLRRDVPGYTPSTSAVTLSCIAVECALISGWLGGELVERLGVAVDAGAHLNAPNSLSGRSASEHAQGADSALPRPHSL